MAIVDAWVAPGSLDLNTGQILPETTWDSLVSNVQYLHSRQVAPFTNRTGGTVTTGDVVVVDLANDASFAATTISQNERVLGVVLGTIPANAIGDVVVAGIAQVRTAAAVSRGQFLATSTTTLAAVGNNDPVPGTFGIAASAVGAAGYVTAYVKPGSFQATGAPLLLGLRVQGAAVAPGGSSVGVELTADGTNGAVTAWNRTTNAAAPLNLNGTFYTFYASGVPIGTLSTAGLTGVANVPIRTARSVLSVPATVITLSSIPAGYTHMEVTVSARSTTNADNDMLRMRVNGDTGSNYSDFRVGGSPATGTSAALGNVAGALATSGDLGTSTITVAEYTATDRHKSATFVTAGTSAVGGMEAAAGGWRWASLSAITSVTFLLNSGANLVAGTSVSVYLKP